MGGFKKINDFSGFILEKNTLLDYFSYLENEKKKTIDI